MRCRKDFMDLDANELTRLAAAFNAVYASGIIASFAKEHDDYFSNGIHRGPAFLPWHRHFLLRMEEELRKVDARVTLPYWDWTRSDSRDLDTGRWKSFFGGRTNTDGNFDHWSYTRGSESGSLPSHDDVIAELEAASFTDFRAMEFGSHVPGHTWTGGTMASGESPADPLFYLHHCNVDRLWAIWQLNHAGVAQYSLDNCTGCLQIAATFVELNDPMVGGATPASMLVHTDLGYYYPVDPGLEARLAELGKPPMVTGDPVEISLETSTIVFNDVPEGETTKRPALFRIKGCGNLSFEVSAGPTAPFSLFEPGPFVFPAGPFPTDQLRIWVMYIGGTRDTNDTGTMTVVARDADGVEVDRWTDIPIVANSVARPKVAVAMVLDESGSMLANAGNNRTRLQALQLAATTFVDQLFSDNGLAMMSFDENATLLSDLAVAGSLSSPVRNNARAEIASHGPPDEFPHTSIGAGLQEAGSMYSNSPIAGDFDIQATVVFTDGFEDREPWIRNVTVNERVYAVGVGDAANTQNDILRQIADNSGGFMNVTGALSVDDEFLLEKFFIQVLAGVTNRNIVRDPEGVLVPGRIERVPVSLTRSDISVDFVALSRAPQHVLIAIEVPDGTVLTQTDLPAGALRNGVTSNGYRITLPVVHNGKEHWEGEWALLLALNIKHHDRIATHALNSEIFAGSSLRYHALAHAHSNLRLTGSIAQSGFTPGSQFHIRALLTEYGQPLETGPTVVARIRRPDQTTVTLNMSETAAGEFDTSMVGSQAGAYLVRIEAAGLSSRGQPFTREYLMSAVLGREPQPPQHDPRGDGFDERLCRFLDCVFGSGALTPEFAAFLKRLGIDIDRLKECIARECRLRSKRIG